MIKPLQIKLIDFRLINILTPFRTIKLFKASQGFDHIPELKQIKSL